MNDADFQNLSIQARRFRAALEAAIARGNFSSSFKHFPAAACDYSSTLLGIYFLRTLGLRFHLICSERRNPRKAENQYHAWLQLGEVIVDITSDQFEELKGTIVITRRGDWHKQWKVVSDESPEKAFRAEIVEAYEDLYQKVISGLPSTAA